MHPFLMRDVESITYLERKSNQETKYSSEVQTPKTSAKAQQLNICTLPFPNLEDLRRSSLWATSHLIGEIHKGMKRLVSPALPCGCQTEPPSSYATTNRHVQCFEYFQGVTAADSEVQDR